jgi:putative transposase
VDDQILSLYAKGMSTLDIVANFDEMYGAEIPPGHISQVNYAMIGDGASD